MADDGQRVAQIEMDRAGAQDHRNGNARRRALPGGTRRVAHPTMAEFIPSVLWSLKPLD